MTNDNRKTISEKRLRHVARQSPLRIARIRADRALKHVDGNLQLLAAEELRELIVMLSKAIELNDAEFESGVDLTLETEKIDR